LTQRQKQIVSESFPLIREIAVPVSLLFWQMKITRTFG
jgi:hypothetical protein